MKINSNKETSRDIDSWINVCAWLIKSAIRSEPEAKTTTTPQTKLRCDTIVEHILYLYYGRIDSMNRFSRVGISLRFVKRDYRERTKEAVRKTEKEMEKERKIDKTPKQPFEQQQFERVQLGLNVEKRFFVENTLLLKWKVWCFGSVDVCSNLYRFDSEALVFFYPAKANLNSLEVITLMMTLFNGCVFLLFLLLRFFRIIIRMPMWTVIEAVRLLCRTCYNFVAFKWNDVLCAHYTHLFVLSNATNSDVNGKNIFLSVFSLHIATAYEGRNGKFHCDNYISM